jgi:hypothetical protein
METLPHHKNDATSLFTGISTGFITSGSSTKLLVTKSAATSTEQELYFMALKASAHRP